MTGENFVNFRLLTKKSLLGQFVPRGRDGSKWMYGRNRCMFHYIREHKNLVSYPSNNKSITKGLTSILL